MVLSAESYDGRFFNKLAATSGASAARIVPHLHELVQPLSVVDFGCGVGAWLREFVAHGVTDVCGLDGPWVDRQELQIMTDRFMVCDLSERIVLNRRFDLALCLEVAEHLSEAAGEMLVDNVCRAADVVIFSAAIPGQGGTHHVNEQWPEYWCEKFARSGFDAVDCLRLRFWHDPVVSWWFKQNMFLLTKRDSSPRGRILSAARSGQDAQPIAVVHPVLYEQRLHELAATRAALDPSTASVTGTFRLLVSALKRKVGGSVARQKPE